MANSKPLADQVAIVTGGFQGIGLGIAHRLSELGAAVVIGDLLEDKAVAAAESVRESGGEAVGCASDITTTSGREELLGHALTSYGPPHILVNNAGVVGAAGEPLEVTVEGWRAIFEVNTEGTFFMCQQVIPTMLERGYGRIINISSIAAKLGNRVMIPYNASKAAVIAITRNLGQAYARNGINVNCVLPGIISTPMWDQLDAEVAPLLGYPAGALMKERVGTIPVGRAGTAQDVAAVVGFLAGPESAYMTGQAINVTGGLIAH